MVFAERARVLSILSSRCTLTTNSCRYRSFSSRTPFISRYFSYNSLSLSLSPFPFLPSFARTSYLIVPPSLVIDIPPWVLSPLLLVSPPLGPLTGVQWALIADCTSRMVWANLCFSSWAIGAESIRALTLRREDYFLGGVRWTSRRRESSCPCI